MDVDNGNPFTRIENFYPYYMGGIRINFVNFINWFGVFFEVSGLYSYYKKNDFDTTTGILIFNTGINIDLQFPSLIKNAQLKLKNKMEKERKLIPKYGIDALKNAKADDMIDFPDILFKKDSLELTEQSYIDLSNIADLLKERKSMEISIKIFSKKGNDPILILSLSMQKAKLIKDQLVKMGVEENRIYIPSEVFIFPNDRELKDFLVRIVLIKE